MSQIVENNRYKEPYLGVFGFDSEIAELYGEKVERRGVYVVSVDSPAKNLGIIKGDIIVGLDDMIIENVLDLRIALCSKQKGQTVTIKYIRGNSEQSVNITLSSK